MSHDTPASNPRRNPAAASLAKLLDLQQINLLLVRHGQPGPGPDVAGLLGQPLTSLGQRQARHAAARLAPLPLTKIYCSDMARAFQTAAPLRTLRPEVAFQMRRDLREIYPFHLPHHPPARTSPQRAQLHAQREAVAGFARHLRRRHRVGDVVAVVAHHQFNRLLLATLAGLPLRRVIPMWIDHTAVTLMTLDREGRTTMRLFNCTRHLPPSMIGSQNL